MWASYINHKIRLGKFSQVDYNHDLTKSCFADSRFTESYVSRNAVSPNPVSPIPVSLD